MVRHLNKETLCLSILSQGLLEVLPFAGLINAYFALPAELPAIASAELTTLVMSLLGLGGLRSFEKAKGLTK